MDTTKKELCKLLKNMMIEPDEKNIKACADFLIKRKSKGVKINRAYYINHIDLQTVSFDPVDDEM